MKKNAKKRAPARKAEAPPYWWFPPETVADLREQINTAADGGARLEVRIDAKQSMTLTVVPLGIVPAAEGYLPLNKSNICPPICP